MTDVEAIIKYIQAYDISIPELNQYDYWDGLYKGTEWMRSNFPDSPFSDVAEEYERAIFKVACIKHEIMKEGGANIGRCGNKIQ